MPTQSNQKKISLTDPFPTPRTIPSGWDLSGLETNQRAPTSAQLEDGQPVEMPFADKDAGAPRSPEPFPDIQTVPENWILREETL